MFPVRASMKFIARHFRPRDALLLVVAALVVALYVSAAGGGFALDDSWIHQTYARNLAETGQWAFVPGVPSAASTSPLYTLLLAIGYKLGVNYQLWTHALGALALAVAGMLGARLAERLLPEQRQIGLIAGLTLVLTWHLIWAAASGMETMLFSTLTLALIWLAWRELDAKQVVDTKTVLLHSAVFGMVAALTTLARPEGVMLAGLIGLLVLSVRPQGSWRALALWTAGAAIGFFVLIAPYLVYNVRLTGGLLPDTAAAKYAEHAPLLALSYPARLANMAYPLIAGGQLLLAPGMVAFVVMMARRLRANRRAALYLLPVLWAIALVALYAARLPAPYQHGRYVIPALPSLILVGVVGLLWLAQRSQASLAGRVISRSLMISTLLAFLYFAFGAGLAAYRRDVHIINEEMVASARWIAEHIPPEELLAVHDIGAVGYFAPRLILDLAGLVSPEIVPVIHDEEALWALMRERGARYLMAFPDQVPGKDASDARLCPLFTTNGPTSRSVDGPNMTVYALAWNRSCSS
jgi:4-amino-4-deoxy-L-arabinose transferase-like glycosyltransferase